MQLFCCLFFFFLPVSFTSLLIKTSKLHSVMNNKVFDNNMYFEKDMHGDLDKVKQNATCALKQKGPLQSWTTVNLG